MVVAYKVTISPTAKNSLKNIVKYIREFSPQGAENVRKTILRKIKSLSKNPQKYPIESALSEINGEFRFAKEWNYKIIFEIYGNKVDVLVIIHSKKDLPSIIQEII